MEKDTQDHDEDHQEDPQEEVNPKPQKKIKPRGAVLQLVAYGEEEIYNPCMVTHCNPVWQEKNLRRWNAAVEAYAESCRRHEDTRIGCTIL